MSDYPNPLDRQEGGDHYKDQGIQPFEVVYATYGYEGLKHAIYAKVLKYFTRKKDDHALNLRKAIHCLEILLWHYEKEERDALYVASPSASFKRVDSINTKARGHDSSPSSSDRGK